MVEVSEQDMMEHTTTMVPPHTTLAVVTENTPEQSADSTAPTETTSASSLKLSLTPTRRLLVGSSGHGRLVCWNIYFRQQNQTNDYAEGAPEWDMQALLQNGVFPNPVTNRNRKSILDVLPPRRSNLANHSFLTDPGQCN